MNIALLGNGKTGSKIKNLADEHTVTVFDSKQKPALQQLTVCDVVICFIPGLVLESYIDVLIESSVPVVVGSTGSAWQAGLHKKLVDAGLSWVYAPNFARGMSQVKQAVELFGTVENQISTPLIEETHHTDKLDSPSGTALAWEQWLGCKAEFTDYREADTFGVHKLTIETAHETLSIEHTVKDRAAFADGAIRAAEYLVLNRVQLGLINLYDIKIK